ncbi:insulin-like growth factor-binding protein 1 isoform X1 [Sorex fumeus]|uniref:insulin-like growth factor-binding protein 1 isoform X1 n=1 Tax=Sorex fumeus TaxID=62283 RepID=UPI0024AE0D2E|nr:insulin-like growth factor-binding protein 1 isoform X1 [Sorex fumeus]
MTMTMTMISLLPALLLAARLCASAHTPPPLPPPWRCAPCPAEKLALCPPVPASCPELARSAGCGCCPLCALQLGASCGVTTARCASGLSCRPPPGDPRPLRALTRGQGLCMRESDALASAETTGLPLVSPTSARAPELALQEDSLEARAAPFPNAHLAWPQEKTEPAVENTTPGSSEVAQEQPLRTALPATPSAEDLPILWNAVSNYENIRARGITNIEKWKEPCRQELYKVLDRLAKEQQKIGEDLHKFYLPNCNKNGLYHTKQCETSLEGEPVLCWCVYPWSGKRIRGSMETTGDPNCHQYFNSQH